MAIDERVAGELYNNQILLKEEIDLTREEIGETFVGLGEQLDELHEIVYGPEQG